MSTADAALIALGERFEKRLLEYMDAWLAWASLMRAARAEAESDLAGFSVAIQRNGCGRGVPGRRPGGSLVLCTGRIYWLGNQGSRHHRYCAFGVMARQQ